MSHKTLIATFSVGMVMLLVLIAALTIDVNLYAGDGPKEEGKLTIGFGDVVTLTIGPEQAYADVTPDYTCDGASDDVQFQAALNDLPAGGGKIVVFGGTYDFDVNVTRAIGNVIWEGVGY
ncbi:hypothetical protein HWQ67_15965, partial [Candidatus Magnetobacterium casensis]